MNPQYTGTGADDAAYNALPEIRRAELLEAGHDVSTCTDVRISSCKLYTQVRIASMYRCSPCNGEA
jgi:hypothetical protein